MEIEEIKKAKSNLEVKIADLIYQFETKCGVVATSIQGFEDKDFGTKGICTIKIKIEI